MSQILTSGGSGGGGGGNITLTGDTGGPLVNNSFTLTGGSTGLTLAGSGSTLTLGGTLGIANGGTNATSFTNTNGVVYYDGTRLVNTTVGTATYVLTSNGAGMAPTFQPASGGSLTITGNTGGAVSPVASNFNIESLSPQATFTGNLSAGTLNLVISNILEYTSVTTTPYVVGASDQFLGVTTTSIPITVELPNSTTVGLSVTIKDINGNAPTNPITVTTVGGIVNIDNATTFVMNTAYESANFLWNGTSWLIY